MRHRLLAHEAPVQGLDTDGANLILVVGHYKSGSTWLINLLSLHPSIVGVSETHVFRHSHDEPLPVCTEVLFNKSAWAAGGLRRFPRERLARLIPSPRGGWRMAPAARDRPTTRHDLSLVQQARLRQALLRSGSPQAYCRCFFRRLFTHLRPVRYLAEKTPTNIFQMERILAVFPRARLLAIHRDGRDVAVSDRFFLKRLQGHAPSVHESAERWRAAMQEQLRWTHTSSLWTCAYERLHDEPAAVVSSMLRFLDLAPDRAIVERMIEGASFRAVSGRAPGTTDRRSFYRHGAYGDWRSHFSASDRREFKRVAADMLMRLGYADDDRW